MKRRSRHARQQSVQRQTTVINLDAGKTQIEKQVERKLA